MWSFMFKLLSCNILPRCQLATIVVNYAIIVQAGVKVPAVGAVGTARTERSERVER